MSAGKITTDRAAEIRLERTVAASLMGAEGEDLMGGLAVLAGECAPPLHGWFTDRDLAVVALAWGEVLAGRIQPTTAAIMEHLDGIPMSAALDTIAGKRVRTTADRCQHEDGALVGIGGWSGVLKEIGEILPATGANFTAACRQLRHAGDRRRAIDVLRSIAGRVAASALTPGPGEAIAAGIESLTGMLGRPQAQTLGDGLDVALDRAEQAAADRAAGRMSAASWGIDALDAVCPLRPGGLYVLAARPKVGKTSLALQSAVASAGNGTSVGIVSLEMGCDQLALIVAARACGLRRDAIERKDPRIAAERWATLRQTAADWRTSGRIVVMDQGTTGARVTADSIAAWARQRHRLGGMGCLVVDYCQLIAGADPRASEYQTITATTRTLKQMANDLRIPVLLLSQMSREQDRVGRGAQATPRPPRLSDLRGSGSIEQDADAVVFIHKPDDVSGRTVPVSLIVAAHRHGAAGEVAALFTPRWQTFATPTRTATAGMEQAPAEITDRALRQASAPSADEDLYA